MSTSPIEINQYQPANCPEILAENAELRHELARVRQQVAKLERENTELWRVMKNGCVLPQKRCTWTSMLGVLYETRDSRQSDILTVDYYDLAIKAGMFERPKSEDPAVRREETKRARDKVGRVLKELHDSGFMYKGDVKKEKQDDGTYEVEGVEVSIHGNLIQALHKLSTHNAEIPVREKRGPQSPRAVCGSCGSYHATYSCPDCGVENQPIGSAKIVLVEAEPEPDEDMEPDRKFSGPNRTGSQILRPGDDVNTEGRSPASVFTEHHPILTGCPDCGRELDPVPGGYVCDPCGQFFAGGCDG